MRHNAYERLSRSIASRFGVTLTELTSSKSGRKRTPDLLLRSARGFLALAVKRKTCLGDAELARRFRVTEDELRQMLSEGEDRLSKDSGSAELLSEFLDEENGQDRDIEAERSDDEIAACLVGVRFHYTCEWSDGSTSQELGDEWWFDSGDLLAISTPDVQVGTRVRVLRAPGLEPFIGRIGVVSSGTVSRQRIQQIEQQAIRKFRRAHAEVAA